MQLMKAYMAESPAIGCDSIDVMKLITISSSILIEERSN